MLRQVRLIAIASLLAPIAQAADAKSQPPNFLVILADDLSWHDIGCYGNKDVRTPTIDRLAAQGLRFTHCFTATAMCAPTRQQLLTGLFPVRSGAYPNHSHVKAGTKSIAHHLRDLGYRVGMMGKTHYGPKESFPLEKVGDQDDFQKMEAFITRKSEQPFFFYLASKEPHTPWDKGDPSHFDPNALELPPYFVDTPTARQSLAKYYAEIEYLDTQVARALALLEKHDLEEDTIVLFSSEQGSAFNHAKWTCYDAGLRTAHQRTPRNNPTRPNASPNPLSTPPSRPPSVMPAQAGIQFLRARPRCGPIPRPDHDMTRVYSKPRPHNPRSQRPPGRDALPCIHACIPNRRSSSHRPPPNNPSPKRQTTHETHSETQNGPAAQAAGPYSSSVGLRKRRRELRRKVPFRSTRNSGRRLRRRPAR